MINRNYKLERRIYAAGSPALDGIFPKHSGTEFSTGKVYKQHRIYSAMLLLTLGVIFYSLTHPAFGEEAVNQKNIYRFAIRYLGVRVATVEMVNDIRDDKGTLTVTAKSTFSGRLLFPIDNHYYVEYSHNYIPQIYLKEIKQRRFSLEKEAYFNHHTQQIKINGESQQQVIDLIEEGRDFFTSLLYLNDRLTSESPANKSKIDNDPTSPAGNFKVYANNNYWLAEYKKKPLDCNNKDSLEKYSITLERITGNDYHRSDVLTNNIIKMGAVINLWFAPKESDVPVKAEFEGSPFSVFWYLED